MTIIDIILPATFKACGLCCARTTGSAEIPRLADTLGDMMIVAGQATLSQDPERNADPD
jgi:hypothetical protein